MPHRFRPLLFIIPSVTLYLGISLAAAISHRMPKLYESFATIEIKLSPEANDIEAEKQRFTSSDLHSEVLQKLDLPTRWSVDSETALHQLEQSIRVRQIKGTDLLIIYARSTPPEQAVEMLEALFEAYGRERLEKWEQTDEQKQISELRDAIKEQERKVEELRERLASPSDDITHPAPNDTEFEAEQRRLQEMRLKFLGDSLGGPGWTRDYPYNGMIIHDDPIPGEHPVSPNHYFNLTLGALIGFFAGIPLAFATVALLNRMRPSDPHP